MPKKKNIADDPDFIALVECLKKMPQERREMVGQVLDDLASEENGDFYTTEQAAIKLQLSQPSIRLWIRTGKLKARRFGGRWRIPVEEVERLMNEQ